MPESFLVQYTRKTEVLFLICLPRHLLAVISNLKVKIGSHRVLPVARIRSMGYKTYFNTVIQNSAEKLHIFVLAL
jgi:hypothetical protein